MALSLIDIKDGKLIFNKNIQKESIMQTANANIKIISIIGKARTGKSTFLNCLINYWQTSTHTPQELLKDSVFEMGDSQEHCTHGIDMYYLKEKNILLLDFQGIFVRNSSNDPQLLLLAYLLSDVIIFNESKMLTNATLSMFEPMLAFITYVKKNDLKPFNPKLIFRVNDLTLKIDPTTNMRQMLNSEDDQFQAIRECICDLFDEPFAISTNSLDRKELAMLDSNNFMELLQTSENGFSYAIGKINEYLECCNGMKTLDIFLKDLPIILNKINNEERIDFTKLDVVKNLAKVEIQEWIAKLDKTIYSPVVVDGTNETYKNVVARAENRDKLVQNLKNEFKTIPKNIREEYISRLTNDLNKVIDTANSENKIKADKLMENIMRTHLLQPIPYVYNIKFEDLDKMDFDVLIKPIVDKLNDIVSESKNIHNITLLPFMQWKLKVINDFRNKYNEIKDKLDKLYKDYDFSASALVKDLRVKLSDKIKALVFEKPLHDTYDSILEELKKQQIELLNLLLTKDNNIVKWNEYMFLKYEITSLPSLYDGSCNYQIKTEVSSSNPHAFNFKMKKIFDNYASIVKNLCSDDGIDLVAKHRNDILTERGLITGNDFLYNGYQLVNSNNKTKFIRCYFQIQTTTKRKFYNHATPHHRDIPNFTVNEVSYTMTEPYFNKHIKPIFDNTCKILFEKGYIYNKDLEMNGWPKFVNDITELVILKQNAIYNNICFQYGREIFSNDYKKLALLELFENRFKKKKKL